MSERDAIIETMARGIEPVLFGDDAFEAHRAASPYIVDFAKNAVRKRVDLAISALESAGYVIVRREPDEAMLQAALGVYDKPAADFPEDDWRAQYVAEYRAMIAAQEQK